MNKSRERLNYYMGTRFTKKNSSGMAGEKNCSRLQLIVGSIIILFLIDHSSSISFLPYFAVATSHSLRIKLLISYKVIWFNLSLSSN